MVLHLPPVGRLELRAPDLLREPGLSPGAGHSKDTFESIRALDLLESMPPPHSRPIF
jgi:hypothetical protein